MGLRRTETDAHAHVGETDLPTPGLLGAPALEPHMLAGWACVRIGSLGTRWLRGRSTKGSKTPTPVLPTPSSTSCANAAWRTANASWPSPGPSTSAFEAILASSSSCRRISSLRSRLSCSRAMDSSSSRSAAERPKTQPSARIPGARDKADDGQSWTIARGGRFTARRSRRREQAAARLAEVTIPGRDRLGARHRAAFASLAARCAAADDLYREAIEPFGRTQLRPELARAHSALRSIVAPRRKALGCRDT